MLKDMKALSLSKQLLCSLLLMGLIISMTMSCGRTKKEVATSDMSFDSIAQRAYIYGLPLVLMDITRRQMTNCTTATNQSAPMNQLSNKSSFPNAANGAGIVRPNVDTYYSTAFADVTKEPIVLCVPPMNNRYYMMPLLDAFTNVFESPGSRTGNTQGDTFLISQKNWTGTVPSNIKKENRFESETGFFWLIGRIKCNDSLDGVKHVIPLQNQLKFMPLSNWLSGKPQPAGQIDNTVPKDLPNTVVENMRIDSFFAYLNRLLVDNPPTSADSTAMAQFAKISVGAGMTFSLDSFDTNTQAKMKAIPKEAFAYINFLSSQSTGLLNGWSDKTSGVGTYGINYLNRAVVAVVGLGANLPEDAVYPIANVDGSNNTLNGASNNYKITFAKGKLPPVKGFWSLTMYNQQGYLVANDSNRYSVGHNTSERLKRNSDGSLTVYIQNQPPSQTGISDMDNNWLPAPTDIFNVTMRLYWPKPSVLDSAWTPPAITKY
jgi:hypothetical protein